MTKRLVSRSTNEVQYADPLARYNTTTVRNAVQTKKAGSLNVYNSKSGVNIQRTVTLPQPEGCVDACGPINQEKLAASFSLSGSTASKTEMVAMWNELKETGDLFISDLVAGFLPQADTVDLTPKG